MDKKQFCFKPIYVALVIIFVAQNVQTNARGAAVVNIQVTDRQEVGYAILCSTCKTSLSTLEKLAVSSGNLLNDNKS